jgi:uncharacterized membrane protein
MADLPHAQPKTGRPRRWVKVLLVCSLALNLLIVGAIAGLVLSGGGKWGPRHPPHMAPVGGPLTRALDQEDRHAIAEKMRSAVGNRKERRAARRAEVEALMDALIAVPFEPDVALARMQALQSNVEEFQAIGRDMLIERLTEMSDTERAGYAKRVRRAMRHAR